MKIEINGLKWVVNATKRDTGALIPTEDGDVRLGVTKYRELEIHIDERMPYELFRRTVIHELIHAYTFSFGYHLYCTDTDEEPICDFISAHIDEIVNATEIIMKNIYKGDEVL